MPAWDPDATAVHVSLAYAIWIPLAARNNGPPVVSLSVIAADKAVLDVRWPQKSPDVIPAIAKVAYVKTIRFAVKLVGTKAVLPPAKPVAPTVLGVTNLHPQDAMDVPVKPAYAI
jgi:hypothetical protein